MFDSIYYEREGLSHPRLQLLRKRYGEATWIPCERFGHVFNRRNQNFRLQKSNPALLCALKHGNRVLPAPEGYGIGATRNFYFSHMLNCLYDCRYCFLQGMYRSANYVWFLNYEDFWSDIQQTAAASEKPATFFSGYDCDSLAMEQLTGFADFFVPRFASLRNATLELRTKSVNLKSLLRHPANDRTVVAFSLTPDPIARSVEHGAPPVASRVHAMEKLAKAGWPLGLRFDPIVYHPEARQQYQQLILDLAARLPPGQIHSVSVGPMRFPKEMFSRISKLYPTDKLLAGPLEQRGQSVSYPPELEQSLLQPVIELCEEHFGADKLFQCISEDLKCDAAS